MSDIPELVDALKRERPRHAEMTDTLVDLIESILSADAGLSVPEAAEAYVKALDEHLDRRIGAYVRRAEIVG